MRREDDPVVLIAGPTASGKSALAAEIAREFSGTIINADAMQVYAGLSVITARPSEAEMAGLPHRLYGHVPPREAHSVARWLKEAEAEMAKSGLPILIGGTGLYFMALEQGLAQIPEPDPAIRAHYRAMDAASLHAELQGRAPDEAARLRPSDTQRLSRALEVLQSTGRSLGDWQREAAGSAPLKGRRVIRIYLEPERERLYGRINARFRQMLEMGAMAEVEALLALKLDPALPVMKAIGVPELAGVLAGSLSLEAAEASAQQATRHYAKRQMTWARRNMMSWEFRIAQFSESERAEIFTFIRKKG